MIEQTILNLMVKSYCWMLFTAEVMVIQKNVLEREHCEFWVKLNVIL